MHLITFLYMKIAINLTIQPGLSRGPWFAGAVVNREVQCHGSLTSIWAYFIKLIQLLNEESE